MGEDLKSVDPRTITRPHDSLLTYYILISAMTLVAFPIVFIPLYVRFKTLRYRFDDDGVSMSWGLLFHKEVYLTYRRLQDIHVTRNLVERCGLGNRRNRFPGTGGKGDHDELDVRGRGKAGR